MDNEILKELLRVTEENGMLKKEIEYLSEQLYKYKNKSLTPQEIRDKYMNISKDKKTRISASQRLDEALVKYRGSSVDKE